MQRPEQELHKAVVAHIKTRGAPGLLWWHTANGMYAGGKRNRKGMAIQGAIMKSLGARAGVSDLVFLHRGRFYSLELKSAGNKPTEAQYEFMSDVQDAGGFAAWSDNIDRAIGMLEIWGLLVGKAALAKVA